MIVTSTILIGDNGERIECWCVNGSVYFAKASNTESQVRWAVENNNFCVADRKRACPE